jgi:serine/threonine protein kinase
LNRYMINRDEVLGEGASSICYKGMDIVTGEQVAIKMYKQSKAESKGPSAATLTKFRRQVEVLQELQQPLVPPSDPKLWSEELAQAESGDLFVRLLQYSQDEQGEPGPDHRDGGLYIVTELGQYDLKQYLKEQKLIAKGYGSGLSKAKVHSIAKALVLAVAGLHAKGFTHLDLKPANLMMFGGRWKIIDVDGCVRAGTSLDRDGTISFSPCYCAPEWARFVVQESNSAPMVATPSLDAWSIGMTLCELATLEPVMKHKYQEFTDMVHGSPRSACFAFLAWLGSLKRVPLTGEVERFDQVFLHFVSKSLLVCDQSKRKTLAECLSAPYLATVPATSPPLKNAAIPRSGSSRVSTCEGSLPTLLGTRTTQSSNSCWREV